MIRLLNEREINVRYLARETEAIVDGKEYEFDIIAVDGDTVVVVEVKTTLRLRDITKFTRKLQIFREIFNTYADKKIIGAMAWLRANVGGKERILSEGFLSIRATGNSATILNDKKFKPKVF